MCRVSPCISFQLVRLSNQWRNTIKFSNITNRVFHFSFAIICSRFAFMPRLCVYSLFFFWFWDCLVILYCIGLKNDLRYITKWIWILIIFSEAFFVLFLWWFRCCCCCCVRLVIVFFALYLSAAHNSQHESFSHRRQSAFQSILSSYFEIVENFLTGFVFVLLCFACSVIPIKIPRHDRYFQSFDWTLCCSDHSI